MKRDRRAEFLRKAICSAAIPDDVATEVMSFAGALLHDLPMRRVVWGLHLLPSGPNLLPVADWAPFAGSLRDHEGMAFPAAS